MKQLILGTVVFCMSMMAFSSPALAACKEGEEFTGKNGHTYCVSKVGVNWWSAFTWCEAQGRRLATVDEICNISETERWFGKEGNEACPNVIDSGLNGIVWSSLRANELYVYYINSSGRVGTHRPADSSHFAICW